jgi:hypothetical protein
MEILSYIGVACAVIGYIANIYKKWYCFIFYFISNILLAIHNWNNNDWLQTSLFVFFEIMCVFGAIKWIKESRKERGKDDIFCKTRKKEREMYL